MASKQGEYIKGNQAINQSIKSKLRMKNVTCLLRGQQEGVRVQANQTNINLQEGGDQV